MRNTDHMEIAVYGKGGIGKSTVSANLTAALTRTGLSVLQIGCDPKHDSTRLLMGGEKIPTVLDVLRDKGTDGAGVEDVLRTGDGGAGCIEAGGPKPGVGCAGRGIISAFEFLGKYDLRNRYDRVIYDVLGDVVCGGFAVPVRQEYADAVFLVTSGEYMALYAANNILRGIRNFDGDRIKRVAGIIYNERILGDEDLRVKRFADAVGLPVLVKVPRSDAFARAEERNTTLFGLEGYEREKEVFLKLAKLIQEGPELYEARPLTDEDHEAIVLGRLPAGAVRQDTELKESEARTSMKEDLPLPPPTARKPLYGCAFNGAASSAVHLNDAVVIAHGPKACAFYTWQNISSPGRRNLFNRGVLMPSALSPNFESTDIGHSEAVFGGMDLLRDKVTEALKRKPGAVIVVSTCVSGIIGDDLLSIEDMSTPDIPVIAIPADGDLAGDYMEGLRITQEKILDRLVIRDLPVKKNCINIIGETAIASNLDSNFETVEKMLEALGISVNCRFFGSASAYDVAHIKQAEKSILLSATSDALELRALLEKEYGLSFIDVPLPVGLSATRNWIRAVGNAYGCTDRAEALIESLEKDYLTETESLKAGSVGKNIFLSGINSDMDWILDTALDAGYGFSFIGVSNYLGTPLNVTAHPERLAMIEEISSTSQLEERLEMEQPDIILSAYAMKGGRPEAVKDVIPMLPDLGVMSAVSMIRRWQRMDAIGRKGAWENDRELFEKYYC